MINQTWKKSNSSALPSWVSHIRQIYRIVIWFSRRTPSFRHHSQANKPTRHKEFLSPIKGWSHYYGSMPLNATVWAVGNSKDYIDRALFRGWCQLPMVITALRRLSPTFDRILMKVSFWEKNEEFKPPADYWYLSTEIEKVRARQRVWGVNFERREQIRVHSPTTAEQIHQERDQDRHQPLPVQAGGNHWVRRLPV